MNVIPVLKGIATHIPGLYRLAAKSTGGTISARYCYSVWLRHLVMARKSGLSTEPEVVAELGPGNSLGIGLAAVLSGAKIYYALDIVSYANEKKNCKIFEELVGLYQRREKVPDEEEFALVKPDLESYEFPHEILTDKRLDESLKSERLDAIKEALLKKSSEKVKVAYIVPWNDPRVLEAESIDMILSQAVLEHVDGLEHAYKSMRRWLKPGGFMSHQIDFGSHGITREWNGHWACSDLTWRIIKGKRPYLLNRETCSTHAQLARKHNFGIRQLLRTSAASGISRTRLARRFKDITEEDLTTKNVFIQAIKQ